MTCEHRGICRAKIVNNWELNGSEYVKGKVKI